MPDALGHRLRRSMTILLGRDEKANSVLPAPTLTAQEVNEIRAFFPMKKFFILGHARSGTTLLARLVRLHPEVHCNWQAHFFTRVPGLRLVGGSPEAQTWLRRRSNRWNHGQDLSAAVMRVAADFIMEREARTAGKSIVGDKSPNSSVHGAAVCDMHEIYPDATLIYIVRDGRDVLVSQRFRDFIEERNLSAEDLRVRDALRLDQTPFTNGTRSMFTDAFIRRSAESWVADLSEVDMEGQRLYVDRYISLRYEDLLTEPFAKMRRVWELLGARADPGLVSAVENEMHINPDEEWQGERNEQIASFLPKGKAGNWRSLFTQRDQALFKEIAGSMLIKWGYEKDLDW